MKIQTKLFCLEISYTVNILKKKKYEIIVQIIHLKNTLSLQVM